SVASPLRTGRAPAPRRTVPPAARAKGKPGRAQQPACHRWGNGFFRSSLNQSDCFAAGGGAWVGADTLRVDRVRCTGCAERRSSGRCAGRGVTTGMGAIAIVAGGAGGAGVGTSAAARDEIGSGCFGSGAGGFGAGRRKARDRTTVAHTPSMTPPIA